ncbi:sensor domain-containing diguanylate cyclase [Vibrio taketomensis]|uniref:GGDEF domain-containing protein n=1 Tax=Vibrio taketomensis TaxID=2572923 RepID=UPI0013896325|nr:bacteriohemerythrin [Vibrio taketomensis]
MPDSEIVVFPWNTNFETGIASIDQQHLQLFKLVNKLANALVHENRIEISEIFEQLADYASYHFTEEERVWSEYFQQDDWMLSHARTHHSFLPDILAIQKESLNSDWRDTIEKVLQFLVRWLALHILEDDKKMSLVVRELQAGLSLSEAKQIAKKKMRGSVGVLIDTVLTMYEELSSHAIELIREKHRRIVAERELLALNQQLQQLAITDELCGLYNRRHFMQVIPNHIEQAYRSQTPLCFVSLDLDHFKTLNDSLGHIQGDNAIQQVGITLQRLFCQEGQFIFRMGGEEFLLVATSTSIEQAQQFAESIRSSIACIKLNNDKKNLSHQLTCSVGVFCHTPQFNDDFLYFLERADHALYQAKNSGRNRVVFANS